MRRGLLKSLLDAEPANPHFMPDFMEVTPDNWIGTAGTATKQLHQLTERFSFLAHGLSRIGRKVGEGHCPCHEEVAGKLPPNG